MSLTAVLAGCMVGPDFEKPSDSSLPEEWSQKASAGALSESPSGKLLDAEDLAAWWRIFDDPVLTSLMERAFKTNYDILEAEEALNAARAAAGVSQSSIFPTLDLGADITDSAKGMGNSSKVSFGAGATASWELDVFGGTRRGIEGKLAKYRSALADKLAVKIEIAASVAQNYFEYRASQQELEITKRNLEAQRDTYNTTKRLSSGGFNADLDVVRAMAQVANTSARIPQVEAQTVKYRHAIEFLLGLKSGALKAELEPVRDLPELEKFIPLGVPAQLVKRRPDVLVAQHDMHSAVAAIGETKADFFPRFYVSGDISYSAPEVGGMFDKPYGNWSAGPSVKWNVFQAGKTYFGVKQREAEARRAGIEWQRTVSNAICEVENALVDAAKERERISMINEAVESQKKAFEYSSELFRGGEIEFIDLLDTQRNMLSTQLTQLSSRKLFIIDVIALYKALGGGWSAEDAKDDSPEKDYLLFKSVLSSD